MDEVNKNVTDVKVAINDLRGDVKIVFNELVLLNQNVSKIINVVVLKKES